MGQDSAPSPHSRAGPSENHFESRSNQERVNPRLSITSTQANLNRETSCYVKSRNVRGVISNIESNSKDESPASAGLDISGNSLTPQREVFHPSTAFIFNIDGVLIRGKEPLPGAREALLMLQKFMVPFVFLHSGGGMTEADHAAQIGQILGLKFSAGQFVHYHIPSFRTISPPFQGATVLVLGGVGRKNCEIAEACGFKNVLSSSDIYRAEPDIYPFAELTSALHRCIGKDPKYVPRTADGRIKIDVILIFSSPRDWGLDLQLVTDLLFSHRGILGTSSSKNGNISLRNRGYQQDGQPFIYLCNPAVTWAAKYPQPRMAELAFTAALEGIWNARTGGAELLNVYNCVIPGVVYGHAERTLLDYHATYHVARFRGTRQASKLETVYVVSDNPAIEIAGADESKKAMGLQWKTILVESGLYEAGTVPAHLPTGIVKGVGEAVRLAFQRENKSFECRLWLDLMADEAN